MSVIHNDLLLATDEATGYNLTKSLRFRSSASAYLNRTPASAGNRQKWTWSGWVKRGALGSTQRLLSAGVAQPATDGLISFMFESGDTFRISMYESATQKQLITTQIFRDPSAWYHILVVLDTTQATDTNRVKLYVNGSQVTAFSTAVYPTQNYQFGINDTETHNIGRYYYDTVSNASYFDGYQTEINFIDGQALTPSSFGETDTITGVWKPKRYTGTYGTNGFYLPFTDVATTSGSNAGLGKDFSGNGNYWNTNNISVTAGATYDSMTDVPTLTSATQANYAVMNPLDKVSGTASNGNLTWTASASQSGIRGTVAIPSSGAFYMECTVGITTGAAIGVSFGLASASVPLDTAGGYAGLYQFYASSGGQINLNNTAITTSLGAFNADDVLQVAVDATNTKMWLGKNNTWYDSSGGTTGNPSTGANPTTTASMVGLFSFSNCYQENVNWNFGQRPFAYTPPTGFKALNTYNLPDSTIVAGNKVMDATLYTGNGSTQTITNAGGFKPDLVWVKSRSAATDNKLTDSVRGTTKGLISNTTGAETTDTNGLTAFGSSGFTVGTDTNYNNNTATYVGWQWQAGQGSSSSNTSGSITSTVSVNASAGFSVVTYTAPSSGAFTVGHGLGVAPAMIITKSRSNTYAWGTYHQSIGNTGRVDLNTTSSITTSVNSAWNNTSPTSTVFSMGSDWSGSGITYVAYCWAEIAGFSKFGSYVGNGSADGPFIYTGFRPKFLLIKNTGSIVGYGDWSLIDTSRNTYNVSNSQLRPNTSDSEQTNTAYNTDILSNGFKLRTAYNDFNASGYTYIYAAFAENPFKNALAA
jgi:hypothetical protein